MKKIKDLIPLLNKTVSDVLKKPKEIIGLFKCPNCGGIHMRHAGYIEECYPTLAQTAVR